MSCIHYSESAGEHLVEGDSSNEVQLTNKHVLFAKKIINGWCPSQNNGDMSWLAAY